MITPQNTQLVIIDIQGKLAQIVVNSEQLIKNVQILIKGCQLMKIPIVWVEQNPNGLGATIPEIAILLDGISPISKMTFNAFAEENFRKAIEQNKRNNILMVGIETHVCVYQTSVDFIENGYNLHLVTDAVSSRTTENKLLGIQKIKEEGAKISGTEMVLFELQKTCETEQFKQLLKLIK